MLEILVVTAAVLLLLYVEAVVAARYGHAPALVILFLPIPVLVAAFEAGRGNYLAAYAGVVVAVAAVVLRKHHRSLR